MFFTNDKLFVDNLLINNYSKNQIFLITRTYFGKVEVRLELKVQIKNL